MMDRAIADTILPLSEPIVGIDGKMIAEIPIARGTEIYVGILGSNTNKAMWGEDALEWKPERWLSPLPRTLMETPIPGVYSKLYAWLDCSRYYLLTAKSDQDVVFGWEEGLHVRARTPVLYLAVLIPV